MAEHSIDVQALRRAPAPRVSAEGAALVAESLSLHYDGSAAPALAACGSGSGRRRAVTAGRCR